MAIATFIALVALDKTTSAPTWVLAVVLVLITITGVRFIRFLGQR